jgi:hypothetical protein
MYNNVNQIDFQLTQNFLLHLCPCTNKELEVWKEAKPSNTIIDLLVPEPFQKEFGKKLSEANITFVIKIADLQKVINNENANNKTSTFSKSKSGRNFLK